MPDLNKKELDELFKEGAELQEFPYNDQAWKSLEEQLDKKDRKRRKAIWLWFISGLLSLLVVIYFVGQLNTQKEGAVAIDLVTESTVILPDNQLAAVKKSSSGTKPLIDEENLKEEKGRDQDDNILNSGTNLLDVSPLPLENHKMIADSRSSEGKQKIATVLSPSSMHSDKIQNELVVKQSADVQDQGISILSLDLINNNVMLVPELMTASTIKILNDHREHKGLRALAFTIALSPESSSVGMAEFGPLGLKSGVKISYPLSAKLELGIGFAYSKKSYKTAGSSFNVSNSFWTDNIIPNRMSGLDEVIEIPVELSYFLKNPQVSGFYGTLGIRSYMLHSENYSFEYSADVDRPDLIKEHAMKDENSHWLGALRFSIGYQLRVSNFSSLHVAPYAQIPFSGIGYGKMKVYSAGIQFGYRFTPF